MLYTTKYDKAKKGDYKYAFYLNNRDCLENRRDFVRELNILIERFSRDLDDKGLIIKVYDTDVEKARQDILDKSWNPRRLETIKKTPGILMLDTDFKDFNPNEDNWLYFYFVRDQRFKGNKGNAYTIEEAEILFDKLTDLITKCDCNVYEEIKKMMRQEKIASVRKAIVKEVVSYGIGISADKLSNIIDKIWNKFFHK